ncbi:hypothetical protein LTR53_010584, partial [Teratosphaeriaceae sp. CCFEE 6253]
PLASAPPDPPRNTGASFRMATSTPVAHPFFNQTDPASSSSGQQSSTQQNNPPPSQAGSLFGGAAAQTNQPAQTGGLFGNTTAQPPQQTGGLFGGTQASQPQQQQQQTSSLFGAPPSSNMFGTAPAPAQQTSSLFGNTSSSNLFGNTQPQGSLFANNSNNTTQQQQQPAASNLFGASTAQPTTNTTGLFGSSLNAPQQNQNTSNFFGRPTATTNQLPMQQNQQPSIFGMSAMPPSALPTTLLSASHFRASQLPPPFAGRLTLGQQSAQPSAPPQGAVKLHAHDLRSTTRFADCVPEVQSQFETVDAMISRQERFCREIQALLGTHEADLLCLAPSVGVVRGKAEEVEAVLAGAAMAVDRAKREGRGDERDFGRARRVGEVLLLPAQGYRGPGLGGSATTNLYGRPLPVAVAGGGGAANGAGSGGLGEDDYDTDLIGNYFLPLTKTLHSTLDTYTAQLGHIEAHLRVVEDAAVAQAQKLARRRAGVSGGGGSGRRGGPDETVRELAETLAGFEGSLVGVAGVVGECRVGVEGLVLGRLGERIAGGGGRGGGRAW